MAHSPGDGALQCCILDNILIMADVSGSECSTVAVKMSNVHPALALLEQLSIWQQKTVFVFFLAGQLQTGDLARSHFFQPLPRSVCTLGTVPNRAQMKEARVRFFFVFLFFSALRS